MTNKKTYNPTKDYFADTFDKRQEKEIYMKSIYVSEKSYEEIHKQEYAQEYRGEHWEIQKEQTKRMIIDLCHTAFLDGVQSIQNHDYSLDVAFQRTDLYHNIMHSTHSSNQQLRELLLQTIKLQRE